MFRILVAGLVLLIVALAAGWGLARTRTQVDPTKSAEPGVDLVLPATDDPYGRFGIRGTIDYAVRDSQGRVKVAGVIHNTVNNDAKNEVFNRIAATGSSSPFDAIAALSVSVGSDDPANGVLAGSLALNLDGDTGTGGNQNPADGVVATDFTSDPGKGTVVVTFTAQADSVTVKQIVLTKSAEDDTAVSNGTAIADADIFAYVDVPDVTLNASDTVQYTWTVNVD